MVRTYLEVFGDVSVISIEGVGNKLVLSGPAAAQPERDELLRRAAVLGRDLGLRHDLERLLRAGLRSPDSQERAGQVLTDKGLRQPY